MKDVCVQKNRMVILLQDAGEFPAHELTDERGIWLRGRIGFDDLLLGWCIPDNVQPCFIGK